MQERAEMRDFSLVFFFFFLVVDSFNKFGKYALTNIYLI